MKCLDKKRIKMKQGETLALNERIMLSLVSTGDCPFIVCMSYAFHTPDKLSFILDLMNGECVARPQRDLGAGRGGRGRELSVPWGCFPQVGTYTTTCPSTGSFPKPTCASTQPRSSWA